MPGAGQLWLGEQQWRSLCQSMDTQAWPKPPPPRSNVMLTCDLRAKLTDLGVAQQLGSRSRPAVGGTTQYAGGRGSCGGERWRGRCSWWRLRLLRLCSGLNWLKHPACSSPHRTPQRPTSTLQPTTRTHCSPGAAAGPALHHQGRCVQPGRAAHCAVHRLPAGSTRTAVPADCPRRLPPGAAVAWRAWAATIVHHESHSLSSTFHSLPPCVPPCTPCRPCWS